MPNTTPRLEQVVASLANYTRDAIVITEADAAAPGPRILYVNPAFTAMTGYAAEEAIGRAPRFLQDEAGTDPAERARLRDALDHWRPCEAELLNRRKDGSLFWVELSITPVVNARGWVRFWVAVQREVTQRHAEREALRQALEAAQAAERTRLALLSVVSHAMRTPLNAIIGLAEAIEVNAPGTGVAEYAQVQRAAGQVLLDGFASMLEYADLAGRAPAAAVTACDPKRLALRALRSMAGDAARGSMTLDTAFAEPLPPTVQANESWLLQALRALLRFGLHGRVPGTLLLRVAAATTEGRDWLTWSLPPHVDTDDQQVLAAREMECLALSVMATQMGGRFDATAGLWLPLA